MDQESIIMELADDGDGLSIELPSAESIELPQLLAENLGVDDPVEVLFDDDELTLDEVADAESEDDGISAAVLVKSNVVVVDTMKTYAQRVREALGIFGTKQVDVDRTKFVVNHSEFSYIPQDVFVAFYSILVDMACEPQYQGMSLEECAEESIELLYEATRWSPKLYRPEYLRGFCSWCGRFRKLAQVKPEISKSDISNLVSKQDLEISQTVFETNTIPFEALNNFFADSAASASLSELDVNALGAFANDYMATAGLKAFTVKDAYTAILSYFGSEDTRQALKLTQDELLELSNGELLRQLVLFELNSGFLYPTGIRGHNPSDISVMVKMLAGAIESGSIVAEIIYIIATMMLVTSKDDFPKNMQIFLEGMCRFFLAFLEDPAFVNPVFYGHVQHTESGYTLSYVVGEETHTISTKDLLCDVIGDKTSTYCIPKVFLDAATGHMVCPPPALVTPLRAIANGGRMKVTGAVCFRFSPTVNWLLANKILADEQRAQEAPVTDGLQSSSNSLLQMLVSYDNKFDSVGTVAPIILTAKGYTIYSAGGRSDDGVRPIAVVMDSQNQPVATSGALVYDSDTGGVIASFTSLNGDIVEFVAANEEYQEQYLGTHLDQDVDEISLSDFIHPARKSHPVAYQEYRKAVQRLCGLAALDYSEELAAAQTIIARDLFYVVCVPSVDALLASRLVQVYLNYIEQRTNEGVQPALDPFNVPSLQELADIILGRPNEYSNFQGWNAEFSKVLITSGARLHFDVDDVCEKLDALDLDKLALQALSRGELRRAVKEETYKAFHFIPEIGSRLCVLEDKMVAIRVLETLGDQVVSVFSKKAFLCRAYTSQLMLENIDTIHSILVEKSRQKGLGFTLPLSREVLSAKQSPDAIVLKYFVLERNMYGLLSAMHTAGGEYESDYLRFLEELDLPRSTEITELSVAEFNRLVGPDKVVALCTKYRARLQSILEVGLLNEIVSNNNLQLVKAYDLFNSFHDLIVGMNLTGDDNVSFEGVATYADDFINYAGSLLVSYCPVIDSSAGDIDGGIDRVSAFIKTPKDFVYDTPVEYLRSRDLQDVRVIFSE